MIGEGKYLVGRGEEVRRKRKGRKIFVKGFFGIASVVLVYLKSHLHVTKWWDVMEGRCIKSFTLCRLLWVWAGCGRPWSALMGATRSAIQLKKKSGK